MFIQLYLNGSCGEEETIPTSGFVMLAVNSQIRAQGWEALQTDWYYFYYYYFLIKYIY